MSDDANPRVTPHPEGCGCSGFPGICGQHRAKIEPNADLREVATNLREWYVALLDAGFNTHEACAIIGAWLAGVAGGAGSGDK